MARYNLSSPKGLLERVDLTDIEGWFDRELAQIQNRTERTVLKRVLSDLDTFIRWPAEAVLFWPECDRVPFIGKKQKYFLYPQHICELARSRGIKLDSRANGPAIASFLFAGGDRPKRLGSSNSWSIHHLYSGKFPYLGRQDTIHATKLRHHFTQSAGLVAAHPIADAVVDEYPFVTWLLRARGYLKFGYDPDHVFARQFDEYGFKKGRTHNVIAEPLTEERLAAR